MGNNSTSRQIFINGKIFTSNPEQPYASSMIVRDGKIVWIGDQSELVSFDGDCINLKGHSVLPGFIDAHLHPLWSTNTADQLSRTPPFIYSIKDIIKHVRHLCTTGHVENWIEGCGQLAEGSHADFIVLDQDIFEMDQSEIDTIQVIKTFMDGKLVYKR